VNILLDENLDWPLRRDLPGHSVESVPLIGWAGFKNGMLLAAAEQRFDHSRQRPAHRRQRQKADGRWEKDHYRDTDIDCIPDWLEQQPVMVEGRWLIVQDCGHDAHCSSTMPSWTGQTRNCAPEPELNASVETLKD
jgi:hypothetical protein